MEGLLYIITNPIINIILLSLEQIFMKYSKLYKLNIQSNFQYSLYIKPIIIVIKINILVRQSLKVLLLLLLPII